MSDAVVELKNATIFHTGNQSILKNVDIAIREGEFTYLIGKTGSGKSSLLKTIYGENPLFSGHGSTAGMNLESLTYKQIPDLRRRIGIVFQDFQLLTDRTVGDNLVFVLEATDWKESSKIMLRIREVLDMVGLQDKADHRIHQLSGGEQQRIAIARALLNYPVVILADEPTGNLDPDVTDDIMQLLHEVAEQGTAILMATHDYRIINKFPGKIFRIEGDQVVMQNSILG